MKSVIFTIRPHSFVDVITNSSSELFVGKADTKEILQQMIKEVYPRYLNEYSELKSTSELSNDEIDTYLNFANTYWSNGAQAIVAVPIEGIPYAEMFEEDKTGRRTFLYIKTDFVEKHRDKIIKALDPNGTMFFLFSKDENPNWEMQEGLMEIMDRYHLG
jgi:hypothetical protein